MRKREVGAHGHLGLEESDGPGKQGTELERGKAQTRELDFLLRWTLFRMRVW